MPVAAEVELFSTAGVVVLLCGYGSWVVSRNVEQGVNAFAALCCGSC